MNTANGGMRTLVQGALVHPWWSLAATICGLANGAAMVLGAMAIAYATDTLIVPATAGEDLGASAWVLSSLALVGVSILRWGSILFRGVATGQVQYRSEATTRQALTQRYLDLGLSWHRRHPPGQLQAHAISDAEAMWAPMQWAFFAVGQVGMLFLAMAQLCSKDLLLGFVGAGLIVSVLGLNLIYQRLLSSRTSAVQIARADVARIAHESVDGGEVVRALGLARDESTRFGGPVARLESANRRTASITSLFDPVLELVPTVAVLVVIATAPSRIASGQISVGDLVGVVYLLITIAVPLNIISRFLSMLPLSVAGGTQVARVMASTETPPTGELDLTVARPLRVELAGISLRIGSTELLRDVDLTLPAGTLTAVVGPVGAGKTTLLEVVGGLLVPTSGRVTIDGMDLSGVLPQALPKAIAVVPQTPLLFATSIRDNLLLDPDGAPPSYTEEELWAALRDAVADDVVSALPRGLDTVVGERGATLSGGQRQRISLARALLRNPRLLVLDDPSSALDARVEHDLMTSLGALASSRSATILLVANRREALALADQVVLLTSGQIAAVGTHRDLSRRVDYRRVVGSYETTPDEGNDSGQAAS